MSLRDQIAKLAAERPEFREHLLPLLKGAGHDKRAFQGAVFAWGGDPDIELIYYPFKGRLEIGMGGEWWGGPVKLGKNVYTHRKERGDPAYKPVTVHVEQKGHDIRFAVGGGFGYGHTFALKMA